MINKSSSRSTRTRAVWVCVLIALGCGLASAVFADVLYVDNAAPPGFQNGTIEMPFASIGQGIANASGGDQVVVAAGTYYETIIMKDGVAVTGAGASVTVIDGSNRASSVVTFNGTKFNPRLSGFTIRGGRGEDIGNIGSDPIIVGGGILIIDSSPYVADNWISANVLEQGYVRGGGIYISIIDQIPQIIGNHFSGNVARSTTVPDVGSGGAIYVNAKIANLIITDNTFDQNSAYVGGALYIKGITNLTASIQRNTFWQNEAEDGAAIWSELFAGSTGNIINNLFVDNGSAAGVVDCDDDDADVGPGFPEICDDLKDNDCDPTTPDVFDTDQDGYLCNADCDDVLFVVNPAALEKCDDLIDNDCNGDIDLADADCLCDDLDGDGYACSDCNDADALINPGIAEICNDGIDNDCDGATVDVFDLDSDGHNCLSDCNDDNESIYPGAAEILCDGIDNDCNSLTNDIQDGDNDRYTCDVDCNDSAPAIHPRVAEFCFDGVDNNCDGFIDDDDLECACSNPIDADLDTYRCTDCNDSDPDINPSINEICNDGVNNDCNNGTLDIFDTDGDLFDCSVDCADTDPAINPDAFENCSDGVDNDCDTFIDGADDECLCADADGDGFACSDCDDTDPDINPGSPELCDDGKDNDCDPLTIDLFDNDGDGFDCTDDCRDNDITVRPNGGEHCYDMIDNDCDGLIDFLDPLNLLTDLVEFGTEMRYLPNYSDPGFTQEWTEETFDDTLWANGLYGVGYEQLQPGGSENLLLTQVVDGAASIYTRSFFWIEEAEGVNFLFLAADWDDGYVAYINGVEVYRSPQIPAGLPPWDLDADVHESSNGIVPDYGSLIDLTSTGIPLLKEESYNLLAIAVYNDVPTGGGVSSDMVLVPLLQMHYGSDDPDCFCDDLDGDGYICDDCDDTNANVNPGQLEDGCDGINNDCWSFTHDVFDIDGDGYECNVDCDEVEITINPGVPETVCDFINNDCDPLTIDLVDADGDTYNCDCEDDNADVHPGALEVGCDGHDNDCNTLTSDIFDVDGDGVACDIDCDETSTAVNPDSAEKCDDGLDNDCDGFTDVEDDDCACDDLDFDGYACTDCNDGDPLINPGVAELCNDGIDNDCDAGTSDTLDADGDGASCVDDCDDGDPFVRPGAFEICNDGKDNDCDAGTLDLFDADGDGFTCDLDCDDDQITISPNATELCNDGIDNDCDPGSPDLFDNDADTYDCTFDCNEFNPAINPGALEICNDGLDNDCNAGTPDLFDADGDGHICDVDCDDTDPARYPGAGEHCGDGIDNDCDDLVDAADIDGCSCDDLDVDSYACDDCQDGSAAINPGVVEVCNDGLDNDCDSSTIDVGDLDGDGHDCVLDCNDADPTIHPGTVEVCADGVDNDCDGLTPDIVDLDGDTFSCDVDCDDDNVDVNPGIAEIGCDGIDNDCDPLTSDVFDTDADNVDCADSKIRGGAVSLLVSGSSSSLILHNTLVGNSQAFGLGGAMWLDDQLSTESNVVANNILDGNLGMAGVLNLTDFGGEVRNNSFIDNVGGDMYDAGGSGHTQIANLFGESGFQAPASNNYRLRQTSALIDAADPAYSPLKDRDRFPRPFDGDEDLVAIADIGAYEFPSGEILDVVFVDADSLSWKITVGFQYNLYRGLISRLRVLGQYTQSPTSAAGDQFCGILPQQVPYTDTYVPVSGKVVFYLVTLTSTGFEGTLGFHTDGTNRLNSFPCP